MNVTCPLCGSENVSEETATDYYPIPFCGEMELSHPIHYCSDCEEDGDFDGTLDGYVNKALHEANTASAPSLIKDLAASGVTMTYFEKALRIPFKTTSRWKRGEISQAALALLRIIRFSPRLLEVADSNFSEQAQALYQLSRPCSFFGKNFDNSSWAISKEAGEFTISFSGSPEIQISPQIESGEQTTLSPSWKFAV